MRGLFIGSVVLGLLAAGPALSQTTETAPRPNDAPAAEPAINPRGPSIPPGSDPTRPSLGVPLPTPVTPPRRVLGPEDPPDARRPTDENSATGPALFEETDAKVNPREMEPGRNASCAALSDPVERDACQVGSVTGRQGTRPGTGGGP
ncbi:MAG TPA: hypothetical protein VED40_08325 [Azospirillaceae bacterium]|nr:hypothetical protein [Azospirillaceae bacterium]